MKKNVLFCLLLVACMTSYVHAQITLTGANTPIPGDLFEAAQDTLPSGISTGMSGPNQTWDFTNLQEHTLSFQSYVSTSGTSGESEYPNATVALDLGFGHNYYELTDSFFLDLGLYGDLIGTGMSSAIAIEPHNKIMKIPSAFGDTYTNDYTYEFSIDGSPFGVDSLRVKRDFQETAIIDAWGTVTMPFGNYDVLRVQKNQTVTDSVWIQFFGVEQLAQAGTVNQFIYDFLAEESKGTLVSVAVDNEGIATAASFIILPSNLPPVAAFSYTDNTGGNIAFMDESQFAPDSWMWDLGDGNTSTDQNPVHNYGASGDYTVCLTASNVNGSDMTCQTISINSAAPPQAAFSFDITAD